MEPERTVNTCSPKSRAPTKGRARMTTSTTRPVVNTFQIFFTLLHLMYLWILLGGSFPEAALQASPPAAGGKGKIPAEATGLSSCVDYIIFFCFRQHVSHRKFYKKTTFFWAGSRFLQKPGLRGVKDTGERVKWDFNSPLRLLYILYFYMSTKNETKIP